MALAQELRRRQTATDEKTRLENDLAEFFKEAWKVLEPGRTLSWSWHYDLLCEYLYLIREGKLHEFFPKVSAFIANVPPRTAKSSFITICFPVWCWTKYPERRFMFTSYSADLSTEHSVRRLDLLRSSWFQKHWGKNFRLKFGQQEKDHFDNDKTGSMIATSMTGTATGSGGDTVIIDDPLNPKQALSDVERKNANDAIDNTFRSRLNDQGKGILILVMQRLHEMDPTGFLLNADPEGCIHIKIPLEAEEKEVWKSPRSGKEYIRLPGDILQPDRNPPNVINRMKIARLVWASQSQQRPSPLEGNMIRRDDVMYYGGIDPLTGLNDPRLPDQFDLVLVSVDCAFKDLETSDFVAIGKIGVKDGKRYVLDLVNKHLDLDATEMAVRAMCTVAPLPSATLVEDKANGSAIIRRLKKALKSASGISGVIPINPEGGKVGRVFASAPEWQSKDWYVSRNAAWAEPFITQLLTFPNASHDDMVDMMSQASVWLQARMAMFALGAVGKGDSGTSNDIGSKWSFGGGASRARWGEG